MKRLNIWFVVVLMLGVAACRKDSEQSLQIQPAVFDFNPQYAIGVDGGFFVSGFRANNENDEFTGREFVLVDDAGKKLWTKGDREVLGSLGLISANTTVFSSYLDVVNWDGFPTIVGLHTVFDTFVPREIYVRNSLDNELYGSVDNHTYLYAAQYDASGQVILQSVNEIEEPYGIFFGMESFLARVYNDQLTAYIEPQYGESMLAQMIDDEWTNPQTVTTKNISPNTLSYVVDYEPDDNQWLFVGQVPQGDSPQLISIREDLKKLNWSTLLECDEPECLITNTEMFFDLDLFHYQDKLVISYSYANELAPASTAGGIALFDKQGNLVELNKEELESPVFNRLNTKASSVQNLVIGGSVGTEASQSNRPALFYLKDGGLHSYEPLTFKQGANIAGMKELGGNDFLVMFRKFRSQNNTSNFECVITKVSLPE